MFMGPYIVLVYSCT